jgi:hypothetical protein
VVVNAAKDEGVVVEGVEEGDAMEGLTKKEEEEVLDGIANAPGELKETPKKKRGKK